MMGRPSFEHANMHYALNLSERSTCQRGTKVGVVITRVDFRSVLAIGYNGNASGLPNQCDRTGPEAVGNCGCIHAEENAAISCNAPRDLPKIVFSTHLPCVACAKRLIQMGGVQKVFYMNDYRIRDSLKLFDTVKIEHTQYLPEDFTTDKEGKIRPLLMHVLNLMNQLPQSEKATLKEHA